MAFRSLLCALMCLLSISIFSGCQNGLQFGQIDKTVGGGGSVVPTPVPTSVSNPAVGDLEAKITESLAAGKPVTETLQAAVDYLKTQDAVADAGLAGDGSGAAWARYKSGGFHIIAFDPCGEDNVTPADQKAFAGNAVVVGRGGGARVLTAKVALPANPMIFINVRRNSPLWVMTLANLARAVGYGPVQDPKLIPMEDNASINQYGRIDWFKTLGQYSMVYLDTVAVCWNPDNNSGPPTYGALMTTETFSEQRQVQLIDEIEQGRVCDGTLVQNYGDAASQAVPKFQKRYFITNKFLETYGSTFKPGSLVYLDECGSWRGSDAPDNATLIKVLKAKGASAVLGWNDTPDLGDAVRTAGYFYSRMFGVNQFPAASPPNRPFAFFQVYKALQDRQFDKAKVASVPGDVLAPLTTATLAAAGPTIDDAPLWRPTIGYMTLFVDNSTLLLKGNFGETPGTVQIGSKSLTVIPGGWSNEHVTVAIDSADYGLVAVTVDNITSNAVPLSQWTPQPFAFHFDNGGGAVLFYSIDGTMSVRFRGDVHAVRNVPDEPPQTCLDYYTRLELESDSQVLYTLTGHWLNYSDSVTYPISGDGTSSITDPHDSFAPTNVHKGAMSFSTQDNNAFGAGRYFFEIWTYVLGVYGGQSGNAPFNLEFWANASAVDPSGKITWPKDPMPWRGATVGEATITIPSDWVPDPAPDNNTPG